MRKRKIPIPNFKFQSLDKDIRRVDGVKVQRISPASPSTKEGTLEPNKNENHKRYSFQDNTTKNVNYLPTLLKIETSIQLWKNRKGFSKFKPHVVKLFSSIDKFLLLISNVTSDNPHSHMVVTLAVIYLTLANSYLIVFDDVALAISLKEDGLTKNRLDLLTKCYRTYWNDPEWRRSKYEYMRNLSTRIENRKELKNKEKSTKEGVFNEEAYITPGMNLEERVRARSKHSNKSKSDTMNHQSGSVHLNPTMSLKKRKRDGSPTANHDSNDKYLAIADIVRSHLRHAFNRSFQFQNTNSSRMTLKKSHFRPLSLRDVCNHLVSNQGLYMVGKCSKKEMKKLVLELSEIVPEWLLIVKDKDGSKSFGSTVMIKEEVPYHIIRQKLGARYVRNKNKKDTKSLNDNQGLETQVKRKKREKRKSIISDHRIVKEKKIDSTAVSQKRKTNVTASTPQGPKDSVVNENVRGGTPIRSNLSSKLAKGEPLLRINFNQMIADSDYSGGQVIQSNSTNPRGLKRMFSQLNAGGRI